MFSLKRSAGFTLFEVIIAVALVAIMAVAIAPPLIKNLNEGKMSRAQSDARVIGEAILGFYKDTGEWPIQNDADTAPELTRLVGNATLGGGNNGIPDGVDNTSRQWRNRGTAATLSAQLIQNININGSVDPLYTESQTPHVKNGWNGPYLDSVPLDPWGNPFVVNILYTRNDNATYPQHNVLVISAGPNEIFETPFSDTVTNEQFGGDDIGYVFRGSNQQ
jgi:prepilin-type N-terminal cleavage/methylation domain-containing protein